MKWKGVCLGWLLFSAPVWLSAAGVSFQIDVASRYIWRGFDLFSQNQPALQPAVGYDFGQSGLSLNVWCSFPVCHSDRWRDQAEIDLSLEYTLAATAGLEIGTGFTHYGYFFARDYSCAKNSSQEVFFTATLTRIFLKPTLAIFYDFHQGDGWYLQLSSSRDQGLANGWEMSFAMALGYNVHQFISASGLSDLTVSLALRHSTGRFTISPFLAYGRVFLREVNSDRAELWFGLSLTG